MDKYSESMKQLATTYWESNGEESRVEWVKEQVLLGYSHGSWFDVSPGGKIFLGRRKSERTGERPEKTPEVERQWERRKSE